METQMDRNAALEIPHQIRRVGDAGDGFRGRAFAFLQLAEVGPAEGRRVAPHVIEPSITKTFLQVRVLKGTRPGDPMCRHPSPWIVALIDKSLNSRHQYPRLE